MNKYGLIGSNVANSYSKKIHEYLFQKYNIKSQYDLLSLGENELELYIDKLRRNEYSGFNVTIPYKTKILEYVDVLSNSVKEIGACNTVYCRNGLIYADNTDVYGFDSLLKYHNIILHDVFVLGSGGSSKAISYVLKQNDIKHNIISRNDSVFNYKFLENNINKHAIINTTPIGMYPNINESVLPEDICCKASCIVDIIYNPKETLLMSYNKKSFNGIIMLIYQAIFSFEIWNDIKVDIKYVEEIIKEIGD